MNKQTSKEIIIPEFWRISRFSKDPCKDPQLCKM